MEGEVQHERYAPVAEIAGAAGRMQSSILASENIGRIFGEDFCCQATWQSHRNACCLSIKDQKHRLAAKRPAQGW